mmetsp:Transcript_3914/g.9486  ORF Transcript_3914/g.9486 Transcript_3914/m.9486 type:complete len:436 (+) Transcript_3914:4417-5724(+)
MMTLWNSSIRSMTFFFHLPLRHTKNTIMTYVCIQSWISTKYRVNVLMLRFAKSKNKASQKQKQHTHAKRGGHLDVLRGSGKIDLGPSQLRSEVVDVSCQKDGGGQEEADEDGRSLGLVCGGCSDDTVLTDDLDTADVTTCRLVGVVDTHLGLALSSDLVDVLACLADFSVGTARHTVEVDDGLGRVRQLDAVVLHLEDLFTLVGEDGTCVVHEDTDVDLSTLLGAVGTDVVLDVVVVVVVVSVVGELAAAVVVVLHGLARHEGREVDVAVSVVGELTLSVVVHVVLLHLVQVRLEVCFHVDDVVTVVGRASEACSTRLARVGGAHAETNKALGLDADILLIFGILVPLLDVVTSLELHAVSREEGDIDIVPVEVLVVVAVVVVVVVVQLTGVLHQGFRGHDIAVVGVDDGFGTGTCEEGSQGEDGNTRKHGGDLI